MKFSDGSSYTGETFRILSQPLKAPKKPGRIEINLSKETMDLIKTPRFEMVLPHGKGEFALNSGTVISGNFDMGSPLGRVKYEGDKDSGSVEGVFREGGFIGAAKMNGELCFYKDHQMTCKAQDLPGKRIIFVDGTRAIVIKLDPLNEERALIKIENSDVRKWIILSYEKFELATETTGKFIIM